MTWFSIDVILIFVVAGTDFKAGYGGKGANQCVAAQRVGAKTAFVGKVCFEIVSSVTTKLTFSRRKDRYKRLTGF